MKQSTHRVKDFVPVGRVAGAYRQEMPHRRSLGEAILLRAIADYRSTHAQAHGNAAAFLFPRSRAGLEHFDWVIWMMSWRNASRLRTALDRCRMRWDVQRQLQLARSEQESLV